MVQGTIKSFGAIGLGDQRGASEVLDPGFWLGLSRRGVRSRIEFVQMRYPTRADVDSRGIVLRSHKMISRIPGEFS